MNHIQEFNHNWKPSLQGAREHVKMTIKHYSQLDKLLFYKQLDITFRGLIVVGVKPLTAQCMIVDELLEGGHDACEWLNERTTSEIIAS